MNSEKFASKKIDLLIDLNLTAKNLQNEIDNILKQLPDLDMEKQPVSMGLLSGYAGEGLLRLTALNSTYLSWMQLL